MLEVGEILMTLKIIILKGYYKESTLPLPGTGGTVIKEQEG